MKVRVFYETRYRYEDKVSFSPHVFRLFPKADTDIRVDRFAFETNEGADIQHRRDLFDNIATHCYYPDRFAELWARLEMEVELRERNAFHFLLDSRALEMPFHYQEEELLVLQPFLRKREPGVRLPFWHFQPGSTIGTLVDLNRAIQDHLRYERRDEGAARLPEETLSAGAGACRDFAVLLAETLRGLGIAARLASGYLLEFGDGARTAEGALHAWTEAYLPGAGWIGMDPTNGVFCNHLHIPAAVGIGPADVTPISGTYYADRHVSSSMSAQLQITTCPS